MNHLQEAKHKAEVFTVDGYNNNGDWLPVISRALIAIAEQLEISNKLNGYQEPLVCEKCDKMAAEGLRVCVDHFEF